ncbi:MAG: sigma-70 family RNA polymerase sigma factor [Kofleriaceae bacterium]|nr:sigma-70 family RNA polymerase sigma factor [Myxococcales bacterium]MCB9570895.1 sigma-70 family RNA polymerase sigma factor [Kofleriaceae bacterium]
MTISDDVRLMIRHLYFGEHMPMREIAEHLGFSIRTVRRALVIDGGVRPRRARGPYHKENDS